MSASYPASLKTFSSAVDGVTKLVASLFNSPYDEITAIETLLGVMGSNQGFTESFKNLLTHFRSGLRCIFNSSTQLTVGPGELVLNDGSGNYRFRRNTGSTTVDFTMLDTGVKANSTIYYIYATADASATTMPFKLSLSSSAPSGSTYYRQIGFCATDGSGNLVAGVVQNLFTYSLFGEWQVVAQSTIYQALTDGFVIGYAAVTNGTDLYIATDGTATPTTVRFEETAITANAGQSGVSGLITPVRKGDYWVAARSGTTYTGVWWLPIGCPG